MCVGGQSPERTAPARVLFDVVHEDVEGSDGIAIDHNPRSFRAIIATREKNNEPRCVPRYPSSGARLNDCSQMQREDSRVSVSGPKKFPQPDTSALTTHGCSLGRHAGMAVGAKDDDAD